MLAGIPPWLTWTVLIILGLNVVVIVGSVVTWLMDREERDFRRWKHEMEDR